jgi:hypothetical protein
MAEPRPPGRPPVKVLPKELLSIFPHARTSDTRKKCWVFSDSMIHLGKNPDRAKSEWQLKEFIEYSEQNIGTFHPRMHFASQAGGKLQWIVESIEQLMKSHARDGLAENFQDDILGICCMTEVFGGNNKLLPAASQDTLHWAQKLSDLAKRLPNFTFIGPGNDETWQAEGFKEVCTPVMEIISSCGHPIFNPCQYLCSIPKKDKWHFNGEEKAKRLIWRLIASVLQVSHTLH